MTLYEVYTRLKDCTGRADLALLGTAIFAHERGPRGYEAGYGYTDSGALPEWEGKQIEGVCGELNKFFGRTRPLTYSTLQQFQEREWRASDPRWAEKVWRQFQALNTLPPSTWANRLAGRTDPPRKPYLGVEEKLRGSQTPQVQERLAQYPPVTDDVRKWVAVGLGIMGLAWVWGRYKGRV